MIDDGVEACNCRIFWVEGLTKCDEKTKGSELRNLNMFSEAQGILDGSLRNPNLQLARNVHKEMCYENRVQLCRIIKASVKLCCANC